MKGERTTILGTDVRKRNFDANRKEKSLGTNDVSEISQNPAVRVSNPPSVAAATRSQLAV